MWMNRFGLSTVQVALVKVIAIAAVIGALWWAIHHFIVNPAVNAETARWQQRWDARDKADAAAALKQEKEHREKELALQAAADETQRAADAERSALARQLADQRASSERLQLGIKAAIDALNTGSAVAGAAVSSTTRAGTGVLLAELYRSINQRAGDLATEADRARAAGLRCESIYNAARESARQK